ncbi:MAG: hypothetical protein E5V89_02370 [Mesorhizobium sp.]|nr:MAG: hypothetical protein E5V89_02370 [Mesorhizobium sp.]
MALSDWLKSLSGHYPESARFTPGLRLTKDDSRHFAALWLSEGVPFAFQTVPAIFQIARENLAQHLSIPFRDVSMTGSGRIGYSMSPAKFGAVYSSNSDVDLFIVSERWFEALSEQAIQFLDDYKEQKISPANDRQRGFWDDSLLRLPKNIQQGFLDAKKVSFEHSPAAKALQKAADRFRYDVNQLSAAQTVKDASIRAYKDWNSAISQIAFNVRKALEFWEPVKDQAEGAGPIG